MGLLPPSRGRITWAGGESGTSLRGAIMFQRPVMLRRSAGGNLRYALRAAGVPRAEQDKCVRELLQLVGLEGFAERAARKISGGEQQRLALARALARDPTVLFLDEPTASLDPAATRAFEDVVQSIARRGIKIVMSTHDLGEARRLAGDVILLHRGTVVEHTPASEFFSVPRTRTAAAFLAGELLT
jgi:tungstate transport system ATP-binding protein